MRSSAPRPRRRPRTKERDAEGDGAHPRHERPQEPQILPRLYEPPRAVRRKQNRGKAAKEHHRVPGEDHGHPRGTQAPVAPLVVGTQGQQAGGQQHDYDEQREVYGGRPGVRGTCRRGGTGAAASGPKARRPPCPPTRPPNQARSHALSSPLRFRRMMPASEGRRIFRRGLFTRVRGRGSSANFALRGFSEVRLERVSIPSDRQTALPRGPSERRIRGVCSPTDEAVTG
jgi:hypothetical protein